MDTYSFYHGNRKQAKCCDHDHDHDHDYKSNFVADPSAKCKQNASTSSKTTKSSSGTTRSPKKNNQQESGATNRQARTRLTHPGNKLWLTRTRGDPTVKVIRTQSANKKKVHFKLDAPEAHPIDEFTQEHNNAENEEEEDDDDTVADDEDDDDEPYSTYTNERTEEEIQQLISGLSDTPVSIIFSKHWNREILPDAGRIEATVGSITTVNDVVVLVRNSTAPQILLTAHGLGNDKLDEVWASLTNQDGVANQSSYTYPNECHMCIWEESVRNHGILPTDEFGPIMIEVNYWYDVGMTLEADEES